MSGRYRDDDLGLMNYVLTDVLWQIQTTTFANQTTMGVLDRIKSSDWHRDDLSRSENKSRMKEFAVSMWDFKRHIFEVHIMTLQNTIEGVRTKLRDECGYSHDFIEDEFPLDPLFLIQARLIRHMGNVIKHDHGIISNEGGRSSHRLINDFGFSNRDKVKNINLDIVTLAGQAYLFVTDLFMRITGIGLTIDQKVHPRETALDLIPEVIQGHMSKKDYSLD